MQSKALRKALSAMAEGGEIFVVIGNGEFCKHPLPVSSGILVDGNGRFNVSRLTIRKIRSLVGLVHGSFDKHSWVVPAETRPVARMMGEGRDVIVL